MPSPGPHKVEPYLAAAVALLGMGLTTWAAFTHFAHLVVPGSTLILVGGAWLGCTLARMNVRLLPFFPETSPPSDGEPT